MGKECAAVVPAGGGKTWQKAMNLLMQLRKVWGVGVNKCGELAVTVWGGGGGGGASYCWRMRKQLTQHLLSAGSLEGPLPH